MSKTKRHVRYIFIILNNNLHRSHGGKLHDVATSKNLILSKGYQIISWPLLEMHPWRKKINCNELVDNIRPLLCNTLGRPNIAFADFCHACIHC